MRFVLVFWFSLICIACGGPAETPFQAIEKSKTKQIEQPVSSTASKTPYEKACAVFDGLFEPIEKFDLAANVVNVQDQFICNLPSIDANSPCRKRFDCQGRCIKNPDELAGKCSTHWLVDSSVELYPNFDPNTGQEALIPDNLHRLKIREMEKYVKNMDKFINHFPSSFSITGNISDASVGPYMPNPIRITVFEEEITNAVYMGQEDYALSENEVLKPGEPIEKMIGNSAENSMYGNPIADALTDLQINDMFQAQYDTEFGFPKYFLYEKSGNPGTRIEVKMYDFVVLKK